MELQSKERKMYMRIRNVCGLLGVVLPWLALFSAGLTPHPSPEWWWSISATYYQSPALVGVLCPASLVQLGDQLEWSVWSWRSAFPVQCVMDTRGDTRRILPDTHRDIPVSA